MTAKALKAFVASHQLAELRQKQERVDSGQDEVELILEIIEASHREGTLPLDPGGVRERATDLARASWLRLREAWRR